MLKVGITGQSGFIGTHLFNTLGILSERFTRIPFEDSFFSDEDLLFGFVKKCDAIIHLAAVNRHADSGVIYQTNIRLVEQLIFACETTNSTPHILFSSSTQEDNHNLYGKSKKEGRELLTAWARRNNGKFTGFVIPNVYGPFGSPFYNSVVATFCYQLTHNEKPEIIEDSKLRLIYVGELVKEIIGHLSDNEELVHKEDTAITLVEVNSNVSINVSDLLIKLEGYHRDYFTNGNLPSLNDSFSLNLFNTYLCYLDHVLFFPVFLKQYTDSRGSFVEMIKLKSGGQVSYSNTNSDITRGNHFHTRKAERFIVMGGKAKINIRRIGTDKVISFFLDGQTPSFVDIPIWHTHNIINIGTDYLYTIFWTNEIFDPSDSDTFMEIV